jgi:hypothetical protein
MVGKSGNNELQKTWTELVVPRPRVPALRRNVVPPYLKADYTFKMFLQGLYFSSRQSQQSFCFLIQLTHQMYDKFCPSLLQFLKKFSQSS